MVHFILTALFGWTRKIYFTGKHDHAWGEYHDRTGRRRFRKTLR